MELGPFSTHANIQLHISWTDEIVISVIAPKQYVVIIDVFMVSLPQLIHNTPNDQFVKTRLLETYVDKH